MALDEFAEIDPTKGGYSRFRKGRTPLKKCSPWNIWQKRINVAP